MSDLDSLYLKCYTFNNVDFLQPNDKTSEFDVEFNPDNIIYLNTETDCSYISTEQTIFSRPLISILVRLLIMQISIKILINLIIELIVQTKNPISFQSQKHG